MKIKFCGIRRKEDVQYINELEPDYMGMILTSGFRRSVGIEQAKELVDECNPKVKKVGVFVNQSIEEVLNISTKLSLDVIQLHGEENLEYIEKISDKAKCQIWKAVRVKCADEIRVADTFPVDLLVLEGYVTGEVGGTGVEADWELIAKNPPRKPFLLAGGLTPQNVEGVSKIVKPFGVDVSSGIETDGIKDFNKMKEIIIKIRGVKV